MTTLDDITPAEREFGIRIRGLLLMAVDLIERRYHLGKHSKGRLVSHSTTETIATAAVTTETGHSSTQE